MSPPPASPIKGDDLCETGIAAVAIDSVILPICLCGLAGNGAVLWLLNFRICRNPITIYILTLALADFAFLFLMLPSTLFFLLEGGSCATVTSKYQKFLLQLSLCCYNIGLCLLTAITVERCSSIPCLLCCRCRCPKCLSNMVSVVVTAISDLATFVSSLLCAPQNDEVSQVLLISTNILNLLIFVPSLVISSTIFFTKFKGGSQQQQIKRVDIIVSLTVLLALPLSLWNFLLELHHKSLSPQFVFLLICIHSTIKPFIYFLVGSGWRHCSMRSLRDSLQRVFEEPEENAASSNDGTMDTVV